MAKRYKKVDNYFIEDENGEYRIDDILGHGIDISKITNDHIEHAKKVIESRNELEIIKTYNSLGLKPWICCDSVYALNKIKTLIAKYERNQKG